ncbi:MAG: hypothetical protein IJW62_01285 [Clostridia bacterium]|nr:hypothetical protein [Clostridia bacterium]
MNKRRNARKWICWVLLLLVTLCALPGTAENAPATAPSEETGESGGTADATVEAIAGEIDSIRAKLSTVDQQLSALQPTAGSVWEQKALLDQQVTLLASEVAALDRLLSHYDARIGQSIAEIEELQTVYDEEFQVLAVRLRQSYEEGMPGLLEYFGRSESLLSLLVGL